MRFRFCLNVLSESVFCWWRSIDACLSVFTVARNDDYLKTETCSFIELHGCCTGSETSIPEGLGSFRLLGTVQHNAICWQHAFLLHCP